MAAGLQQLFFVLSSKASSVEVTASASLRNSENRVNN
jgi:hypothetical protein